MKKALLAGLSLVFLFSCVFIALPVRAAEGGEVKMSLKELYSLANRKSYRLGVRGSIISPTSDLLVNKESSYDLGLEFDAKLNENLDTGPRFGISSLKSNTGAVNATYGVIRFGFGSRIYVMYWGDYGSTHGFANLYLAAEANYYIANKGAEVITTSPSNYAGLGGQVGAGLEFAFGPNTGAFVEVNVLRTNVKSSAGDKLPLDGYIAAAGARLAFF